MHPPHEGTPVPGTRNAVFWPITRRTDVCCSNNYVIETPGEIVVIDCGSGTDPDDPFPDLMDRLQDLSARPVLLVLTHCHLDHWHAITRDFWSESGWPVTVAIQEAGATSLERADVHMTIADIFKVDIKPVHVGVRLLTEADLRGGGTRSVEADGGLSLGIRTDEWRSPEGQALWRQRITLGSGEKFEVLHTPGHSPDSVCVRFGTCLFTGDLQFSANPGIAGLPGWDRDGLAASVHRVRGLLSGDGIGWCCPGHGRMTPADTALADLKRLENEILMLGNVATFDAMRLSACVDGALDLLEEANRVFAAVGGRLYYLAFYLELLGEDEAASRYASLIENDRIEEFLMEFSRFTAAFRDGRKIDLQFVLKAVQFIERTRILLSGSLHTASFDHSLLGRAERLLNDFIDMVMGFEGNVSTGAVDLWPLIQDVVYRLKYPWEEERRIMEVVEDEGAFRDALVARMARIPLFEGVTISLTHDDERLVACADAARLDDCLTWVLEDIAADGAREITISASRLGDHARIAIAVKGGLSGMPLPEARLWTYRRSFARCGAKMSVPGRQGELLVVVDMPLHANTD